MHRKVQLIVSGGIRYRRRRRQGAGAGRRRRLDRRRRADRAGRQQPRARRRVREDRLGGRASTTTGRRASTRPGSRPRTTSCRALRPGRRRPPARQLPARADAGGPDAGPRLRQVARPQPRAGGPGRADRRGVGDGQGAAGRHRLDPRTVNSGWRLIQMAKIVCVLYDDPVDGYPTTYARDDLPKLERYPGGQTTPTPEAIDFKPGALLGSVSGELGLRKFLEDAGHTLVVTSDKDGAELRVRTRAGGRRHRHLAAVLAGLSDRRAHRQGAQAEAGDHRRHRLRPRRPAGRDGARHHRRRGHLLQLDQRRRARGDDDPRPRAQLHPLLPVGGEGRLEHRRLRRALLRPRGHARRHRRRRAASAWPCCAG